MMAGDVPGVRALGSASELPVPPPPGVVVVRATDPWEAAGGVARSLGAARLFTAAEACEELDRRRDAAVARARRHRDRCAAEARAARARAATAPTVVPARLVGVSPAALGRAATTLEDAVASVRAARVALGRRPHVDEDVAHEAREAQVLVDLARLQRAALVPRANRVLGTANAAASVIVAGRVVSEAFDPAFVLVAVLPLGALGVVATMVGHTVRRSRSAARRRWAALRSLDLCTLAQLEAREVEARAWDAGATLVAERRRELVRARAAWEALVGPGVPVSQAPSLLAAVEEVATLEAEAEAAARAWADASERLQAAEDAGAGGAPIVVVEAGASPERHGEVVRALARRAGRSPVVVVAAEASVAAEAGEARPTVQAPAAPGPELERQEAPVGAAAGPTSEEPVVVDLRDRVLAGLLRLRARQASRRDASPPGSVAG